MIGRNQQNGYARDERTGYATDYNYVELYSTLYS
jgi:hypothetical protein